MFYCAVEYSREVYRSFEGTPITRKQKVLGLLRAGIGIGHSVNALAVIHSILNAKMICSSPRTGA